MDEYESIYECKDCEMPCELKSKSNTLDHCLPTGCQFARYKHPKWKLVKRFIKVEKWVEVDISIDE